VDDQAAAGRHEGTGAGTVRRSVDVAAPPDDVWALVSDLPSMGAFSPENRGGRWVAGDGPAVGAVFVGSNGAGRRRWSTRSTVVRSEPGRSFAFDVASARLPVARWSYELEPSEAGCRLTEQWDDQRGRLMTTLGRLVTGVADRTAYAALSIEQTLQAVKEKAERRRTL
jgi:carbon monoxide dehydrogenase subunit G